MSDTTTRTPYVSDEQIEERSAFINSLAPDHDEISWMGGAEWMRDLYEARLSEVIKERDEARERAGWVPVTPEKQPPVNSTVVYWMKPEHGGYMAIAYEWSWDDHGEYASHYLPSSIAAPDTPPSNG